MEMVAIAGGLVGLFAHAFVIVEVIVMRGLIGLGLAIIAAIWIVAFTIYTMIARAVAVSKLSKDARNKLRSGPLS